MSILFRKLWVFFLIFLVGLFIVTNLDRFAYYYYPFLYQEEVFHYAQQHDIDPFLVAAVIRTESNFKAKAKSVSGALGLMQIMPATGRWIATENETPDFEPGMLLQPEINIQFGSWYLAYLFREFNNEPVIALAAYNGGRGNVKAWLQEARWTGEEKTLQQIPFPETREYVRRVLRHYKIYVFLYGDENQVTFPLFNTKEHREQTSG